MYEKVNSFPNGFSNKANKTLLFSVCVDVGSIHSIDTGDGLTLFTPIPTQNIGTIKNKSETYSKPYVY